MEHDPLRYEKRMINQWIHREFSDKRELSAHP